MINQLRAWSHKQQMLGRQGTDMLAVLKHVIAVYSAHPTAPLSLLARTNTFTAQQFLNLEVEHLAVRMPAMRLSAFLLTKTDAHLAFRATVPPPEDPSWQKRYAQKGRTMNSAQYVQWKDQLIALIRAPMAIKEIKQLTNIPDDILKVVLNRMCFEGILLRIGASSIRSNSIRYIPTHIWLGDYLTNSDREAALRWLATAYLKAFGPARKKDFKWWAGISSQETDLAFSNIDIDTLNDDFFVLKSDSPQFESADGSMPSTVDLLPQWDCYTMGYAPDGRERFVNKDMQKNLYGSLGATTGNALGTILVDGLAWGTWQHRMAGATMHINIDVWDSPGKQLKTEIAQQFENIAYILGMKKYNLEWQKSQ